MYLEGIILHCSENIQQARSISSIYHLLKGKKGIQTVHDARIFQLENFFCIHKTLDKQTFDKKINTLTEHGLLNMISKEDNLYKPSSKGINWLKKHHANLRMSYYKGIELHKKDDEFFERLQLLIQTYTNIKMNHFSFIPVIESTSITMWVKKFYKKMATFSASEILLFLYNDLYLIFRSFSEWEAHFFIDHMTGYKKYGMSSNQLSEKYHLNYDDIKLLRTALLHKTLEIVEKEKSKFQLLPLITVNSFESQFITNSAKITYSLLKKGWTIDEISRKRKLKRNTINDHVVEIALYDASFPINDYVSEPIKVEINRAIMSTKSYKLKDIKEKVSDSISYFQIRLVLAKTKNYSKTW